MLKTQKHVHEGDFSMAERNISYMSNLQNLSFFSADQLWMGSFEIFLIQSFSVFGIVMSCYALNCGRFCYIL